MYGFRDYDPYSGSFTTEDPIQDGVNWYAYVGGDPINFVDPLGLEMESAEQRLEDAQGSEFQWPLKNPHITSPFGPRTDANPPKHSGIDLRAPVGTEVYAAGGGKVTVADLEYAGSSSGSSYLVIVDDEGYTQRYLHMQSHTVEVGDTVEQGQLLGYTGTLKKVDPHLHFEILKDGVAIDPVTVLPKLPE